MVICLVWSPEALHRETISSPPDVPYITQYPEASWGRPRISHEFACWQTPGVPSSCLTPGFSPVARPLRAVRGLGVFLFLKQEQQLSSPSVCGFADVNCPVFTLSLCNGNSSMCISNKMYFYSQCLRSELVIRSPMLISPTALSCHSFWIWITWGFTNAWKHLVWRCEGVHGLVLFNHWWLIHQLISIAQ